MTQFGGVGRLVRPQCVAGRRHVRPLPGRPQLGQRQLAGVLRRLPARPRARPRARCPAAARAQAAAPAAAAPAPAQAVEAGDEQATILRGAASRIVANMEASLAVPTATSVRTVPARLLEVNRLVLNNQLARTTGAKVSFTHIIGYAVVRALSDVPALNAAFVEDADGTGQARVSSTTSTSGSVSRWTRRRATAAARCWCRASGTRTRSTSVLRAGLRGPDPQDPHEQDRPRRLRAARRCRSPTRGRSAPCSRCRG